MLKGLVSSGTKALGGERFSLVNILPVTLLTLLIVGLVRSGAYDVRATPEFDRIIPAGSSAISTSALLIFVVFLIAVLLQPFQVAIVRLLEGYWRDSGPMGAVGHLLVQHHVRKKIIAEHDAQRLKTWRPADPTFGDMVAYQRRQARIRARNQAAVRLLSTYPTKLERILPTNLGNILRSGEDGAGSRYGLDAMTVYPRMYPFIGGRLDRAMSQQLDMIDSTSALCVALGTAAVAAAPPAMREDADVVRRVIRQPAGCRAAAGC